MFQQRKKNYCGMGKVEYLEVSPKNASNGENI